MKKQDLLIIVVLFALLMAWPFFYGRWIEPRLKPGTHNPEKTNTLSGLPQTSAPLIKMSADGETTNAPAEPPSAVQQQKDYVQAGPPEQLVTITNGGLTIVVSSRGGGIVSATFSEYRQSVDRNSGPMVLDFSKLPSLTYKGLNGFSAADNFTVINCNPTAIVMEGTNSGGLRLTRTIELNNKNQVVVYDLFTNGNAQAATIQKHSIQLGPMRIPASDYSMSGMDYLGIDVLASSGGEGVIHWAGQLAKIFKNVTKESRQPYLPKSIAKDEDMPIDWIAAKNKFFTQILVPDGGAAGYSLTAERAIIDGEDKNPALKPKNAQIESVVAAAVMAEKTLNEGDAFCQTYKLYLGPKKYSILRTLGLHQEDVMEFGMWSPVCKLLLIVLNATYAVIPNYGIAIIILTFLIRIIFWPLTHKSTESMKKMQELQPLMNELKAKYKDSPRKMQEETMALYKKHKVNPVSGCLPMLIQIPVFIALFVVLRSAIEMRFASFLWVSDLSAPERLFADILPIPLNILPIIMAASQAWQQALMPATDANQQKIMLFFMPVMMLVMFYMMPSALVLYWSANQCIVIVQQLIQKKRTEAKAAAGK